MVSNDRAGSTPALGTNWNLKCFVVIGCLIIIVSNVKPQNTKAMKIPVSTPSRTDVVVDVIKLENGLYSATCAEVVNGFGLVPLNNYEVFNEANLPVRLLTFLQDVLLFLLEQYILSLNEM